MRRTTIYRSELMALLAALTPLAAHAQQPPAIQRPIQQAQQAQQPAPPSQASQPSQPSPASPLGVGALAQSGQGSVPASHTVAQGETLWALAQQFFGDPLLWPELYRLNTDVVEDPHWIYPGEELRLVAEPEDTTRADSSAAAPPTSQSYLVTPTDTAAAEPAPVPSSAVEAQNAPTIFSSQVARPRTTQAALQRLAALSYRAVRPGEYYASGFLTENERLNTGRVLATLKLNRQAGTRIAVALYDDLLVSAPPNDTLQPGSLLLVFQRGDETDDYGQIIEPTALLRVKNSEEANHFRATVVQLYAPVYEDQELIDVAPFALAHNQHADPVADGVVGKIIRLRTPHELAQRQQIAFIDKGARDGLHPGDLFEVYRIQSDELHGGSVEHDQARALVVSTRDSTSTVIIIELYSGDIGAGSFVRQIGRMPS